MEKTTLMKRSYLLAGATLILTVLSIWAAFAKTFTAWQLNQELNEKLLSSSSMKYNPAYMDRKMNNLEKIISLYSTDSITYRNHVLATVAKLADAENIRIVEMPGTENTPYFRSSLYQIQKLGFEGDFYHLTRFYNRIQAATGIGRVRASQYILVNQPTSGGIRKTLRFYLYLGRKV